MKLTKPNIFFSLVMTLTLLTGCMNNDVLNSSIISSNSEDLHENPSKTPSNSINNSENQSSSSSSSSENNSSNSSSNSSLNTEEDNNQENNDNNNQSHSLQELLQIDPYYPIEGYKTKNYQVEVGDMKNRIIVSEDEKYATLFAPDVSFNGGYFDVNKTAPNIDGRLCWAASISNMLAWYLTHYDGDVASYNKDPNQIMDVFRNHFDPLEGFDPLQGLAWYFTGHLLSGEDPHDLAKGILQDLPHVGDTWSLIDFINPNYYGNYQEMYPFVNDELYFNDSIEHFCKTLLGQLHYGPTSLLVVANGAGATSGHAITLWGATYEIKSGKIKKIYITDSDDKNMYPGVYLREVKLQTSANPDYALEMTNYYIDNSIPSKYITASSVLYDSRCVKKINQIA